MKIAFQQNTKSGCTFYCIANLLNDHRFIDGVADLTEGVGIPEANRLFSKLQPEYYLQEVFVTQSRFIKQANRLIDPMLFVPDRDIPENERDLAQPYIICVKGPKVNHAILVLMCLQTSKIYVFDSLSQERQIMTVEQLLEKYHILNVAVFYVWDQPHERCNLMMIRKNCPHLFNENE